MAMVSMLKRHHNNTKKRLVIYKPKGWKEQNLTVSTTKEWESEKQQYSTALGHNQPLQILRAR